jgi:hypothetical protein
MHTAREGAMNGATHMEPMIAAGLLSSRPAVARPAAATVMAMYPGEMTAPGNGAFLQGGVVVPDPPKCRGEGPTGRK